MIRNRIIWIVLLILSIVGISFYGGSVSYGFFFLMVFTPIVSLLYLLYVYICFRIYQYSDGKTFVVDDPVPYSFRLINEFPIPFVGIRVRFFAPFSTINELSDKTEYELMPNTGITRETTIVCHYRGEYEIGIEAVEVQDYFRLFKINYINKECKRVTVNPKIVVLKNLGSFERQSRDARKNLARLDVVSREYVPGDDVRFINWSQTARTGALMTRDRIGEEGNGVTIIMDACRYSDDPYEYLPSENKVMELSLAVALFFRNKNINSRTYYYYRQVVEQAVESDLQFESLYKEMSLLHFDEASTHQMLFEGIRNNEQILTSSVVYMVLTNFSGYAGDMVNKLSERSINTVVYLVGDNFVEEPELLRPDLVEVIYVSPKAKLEEELL